MKRIELILFFLVSIVIWGWGQNLSVSINYLKDAVPKDIDITIYIDKSASVRGFFDVEQTRDNDIEILFKGIEHWANEKVKYYAFDKVCYNNSIWNTIGQVRTNFEFDGPYNKYSSAIYSLDSSLEENSIGILITDGVPSLSSKEEAYSPRELRNERSEIEQAVKRFLDKDRENNIVSIYRYFAAYKGWYYLSDNSKHKGSNKWMWKGNRNLYAVVFAKKQHLKLIDDLLGSNNIKDKFDVLKMSPQFNDIVKFIPDSVIVRNENNNAIFNITIDFFEPVTRSIIRTVLDSKRDPINKNFYQVEIISDKRLNINFCIPIEDLKKKGSATFTIVAENGIERTKSAFYDLNIASDYFEKTVFENDSSFHNKTFRLNYLIDAIANTQKPQEEKLIKNPRYGLEIPFSIHHKSTSVALFEPMFGLIPPPATLSALNKDFLVSIPIQLFLFRWLTPIGLACLVFFLFLNQNGMRFTNPQQQKIIWRGGFILNLLIVSIAVCLMMFKKYDNETLALGYQLKHLIYNPVFSLLLYVGLSLILTRRKFCTACDNPIPF